MSGKVTKAFFICMAAGLVACSDQDNGGAARRPGDNPDRYTASPETRKYEPVSYHNLWRETKIDEGASLLIPPKSLVTPEGVEYRGAGEHGFAIEVVESSMEDSLGVKTSIYLFLDSACVVGKDTTHFNDMNEAEKTKLKVVKKFADLLYWG